ncbi:hypothetical protein F2Q69_00015116 [Brassica cretica]|uniref:methionine--tRNA ligase n=1 Tax=Brassica cretica TaxID=69181 RepID=A0A8S9R653_BRACR|nr:hypothetical protein F2Q69_00015116 [Brassica cretica]
MPLPTWVVPTPPSLFPSGSSHSLSDALRLLGKKVIFITGTDEHGEKIATSAAANGRNSAYHCDLISQSYRTLWKELDIAYDKFIRTTDAKHEAIAKEFYARVFANGDIYRADYEGLYCVNCEEYKTRCPNGPDTPTGQMSQRTRHPNGPDVLADQMPQRARCPNGPDAPTGQTPQRARRPNGQDVPTDQTPQRARYPNGRDDEKELLENSCCPVHQMPCVARKEDNYFFALSKYQKQLEEVLSQNLLFVQPSYRLNEVKSWIKSGLRDFSISRALVDWGIPVPDDDKQTIYVWFDALLGYISALTEDNEQQNLDTAVSLGWPASLHLIGKDILRFHAVYWPAMLTSAGLSLPKMVFGHGFLTKDGMKMGKSLGNTLEPFELVQKFGPDAVRYFFLREVEFGNDGDYSEDRFVKIVNAHLANTIGNLLNRTLGLLKKNCESTLVMDSTMAAEGTPLKDTVEKLVEKARTNYESLSLSTACEAVLEIGNAGNSYMDQRVPSMLFKQGGLSAEAAAKNDTKWGGPKGGQVMAQASPVFARIELNAENDVEEKVKDSKKKGKAKVKVEQPQAVAEA